MRYLILILTFLLVSTVAKTNENNFFNQAKDLFDKEKYEDSKFLFHRNIVYNPKDSVSYLYPQDASFISKSFNRLSI